MLDTTPSVCEIGVRYWKHGETRDGENDGNTGTGTCEKIDSADFLDFLG